MATPPVPTPPGSPTGFKLPDGFSTRITFANFPNIQLWEKTVKPPGIDGGAPIDQTTMRNTLWRTYHPKRLQTLTEMTVSCAYDPNVFPTLYSLVNVNTTLTVTFPPGETGHGTGDTLAFYGFMQKFEPEALKEGELPLATVTITPVNVDPLSAEEGPTWTAGTGTS